MNKVIMMAMVGMVMFTSTARAGIAELFDSNSEFMNGFETGLFLRTKGGTVEDYNCVVPADVNPNVRAAFDTVKSTINTGMKSLPNEPVIQDALLMMQDFLDGLYYMYQVLSDEGQKHLDKYCVGMIFGLEGSKMLVKIANNLINPIDKNGEVIQMGVSDRERRQRMGGSE